MQSTLLDYWWVPLVRGIVAILFGVLVLVWPGLSILAFLAIIAAFWIADGALSMYYAAKARDRGWPFWGGLISVAAGVAASPLRSGHKPGTRVFTVESGTHGVATLVIEPSSA